VALTHGADETELSRTAYLVARLQNHRVGSIDSAAAGGQAQAVPRGPSRNCERTSWPEKVVACCLTRELGIQALSIGAEMARMPEGCDHDLVGRHGTLRR
jgi:hypothetical protein